MTNVSKQGGDDARPENTQETSSQSFDEVSARIRHQNDKFRNTGQGGQVLITAGIQAFGHEEVQAVLSKVANYDKFDPMNDPYAEHDFGKVEHLGQAIFWKIDYYDKTLTYGSPDPSDPVLTCRVMTIMLAEEY